MQEKRAAKAAAKKQQQEKARVARAASLAAKAAARAAEEEKDAARAAEAESAGQQPAYDPHLSDFRNANGDAFGHNRCLNGYPQQAQHSQHGQHTEHVLHSQNASNWDLTKQPNGVPARRNGYHLPHANQGDGQLAGPEGQIDMLERQAWDGDGPTGQERRLSIAEQDIDIMYRSPDQAVAHAGSTQTSPEVDIIHSSSHGRRRRSSQNLHQHSTGRSVHSALNGSDAVLRFPGQSDLKHDTAYLTQHQPLKAEGTLATWHMPSHLAQSSDSGQLPSESHASESDTKRRESEEADDTFDWEAWTSPGQRRQGIAERLQRPRRHPKRPYPLPDPSKPKPKKPHSLKGSSHHPVRPQHRLLDRPARQVSTSNSWGQFDPESSHAHGTGQHAHLHRLGSAMPGRAAASQRAAKGRSKGRRALEEVGCIRAAPYQGEAFMQARMDVLEQQGVLPGNQAPADADSGHQVSHAVT